MNTWGQATDQHLAWLTAAGRSAGTIRLRRHYLNLAARSLPRPPAATTTEDLVQWFATRDWSPETRRSARSAMTGFYAWAVTTKRLPENPAEGLPPIPSGTPRPHPVPEDVLHDVLATCTPRVALMIRLAAELGLRRAEVAGVHRDDLRRDLTGWVLVVKGKGRKQRVIPVPENLAMRIRDEADTTFGYLFPGQHGGHLSAAWVGRLVGRELPHHLSMHSLRHRFASAAYGATTDLLTVQQLLGHSNPRTTMGYVALGADAARRAVNAVSTAA